MLKQSESHRAHQDSRQANCETYLEDVAVGKKAGLTNGSFSPAPRTRTQSPTAGSIRDDEVVDLA